MCDDLLLHRSARNVQLARQFLVECEAAVHELARKANGLPPCEQTDIVKLLIRIEGTKRRLRRSVRRIVAVPVLVCSDSPGNLWEEKTTTLRLSRYGTGLACRHAVRVGEVLSLVRLDIGRETTARVVWSQWKDDRQEIGLEHLGRTNFWGWDWTSDDTHSYNSPIYLDNTQDQGNIKLIVPRIKMEANSISRQPVSRPHLFPELHTQKKRRL
jgi:hypothetical protein